MKNYVLVLSVMIALSLNSYGQKCSLYEKDQIAKSELKSWTATKPEKWAKMKQDDKNKFVEEFNQKVEAGTEKATYDGSFETSVKESKTISTGGEFITMATNIAGTDYKTYIACKDDTMAFIRTESIFTLVEGAYPGYTITGIQKIPMKLKVGDVLPNYIDYGETFPETKEWQAEIQEFKGWKTSTETKNGTFYDSNENKWMSGSYSETSSKAVYGTVSVNFKEKASFSMLTINYVDATVAKEEPFTLDGKEYTAYVIESEKWVKAGADIVIKSDNANWQKSHDKMIAKYTKKGYKAAAKQGLTNEDGYIITYLTEWFIPGIGVVKTTAYDNNGFLISKSSWTSLK